MKSRKDIRYSDILGTQHNNLPIRSVLTMTALKLTQDNFEQEVLKADKPVLVDFWAPWCGPCRMVSPIVEEIAGEVAGRAKVGKVNVDEDPELAARYGVMSIPTLIVVKDGKVVSSTVGAQPKQAILGMLGK